MKKYSHYLLPCLILFISCGNSVFHVSRLAMGTVVNITLIGRAGEAPGAAEAAFMEIERLEGLMSPYRESSDVYRVNRISGDGPVPVRQETYNLIRRALSISQKSGGAFDISFPPLGRIWDYKKRPFIAPSPAQIKAALPLVNYRNILLQWGGTVVFKRKGMGIGLGGIAKGYAIQRALMVLKARGISSAIVEAGGDLQVSGSKFGKPWQIGLKHPRKDALALSIQLESGEAVATSGDYERYAFYRGKRYHHILNPHTGYPARGLVSVTVISPDPVTSDAWATALFVMGREKGLKQCLSLRSIAVIMIDKDFHIYISKRLKQRAQLLVKWPLTWI